MNRASMETHVLFLLLLLASSAAVSAQPFFFGWKPSPLLASGRGPKNPDFQTTYPGSWDLFAESSGVAAMHMVVTPLNKAIIYDGTQFQPTPVRLLTTQKCRVEPDGRTDCNAHAVEFDVQTAAIRPLRIETNSWCSAGSVDANGTVVNAGGDGDGFRSVRYLRLSDTSDWEDHPDVLAFQRWYPTQEILDDGSFIVVGGRNAHHYEFLPSRGPTPVTYPLDLLTETTDVFENNLYPFVHLLPDGNVFIFANDRAILLNPTNQQILRKYPVLPGGPRSFPSSGMDALLPIDLRRIPRNQLDSTNATAISAEVIICGGSPQRDAYYLADKHNTFVKALRTCGRIKVTDPNAKWEMETMPMPRIVSDMITLPTGDLLIINGFSSGAAGWECGRDPVFEPLLYKPTKPVGQRFRKLAPSTIPRMYHSVCALLPDGSIMVTGSNPHMNYTDDTALYPTEFRVEKFYPPYFDPALSIHRPRIVAVPDVIGYKQKFLVEFSAVNPFLKVSDLKVTMYRTPFHTHSQAMGQRLVILRTGGLRLAGIGRWSLKATAPPSGKIAPPGYYLLFVVHRGVPSEGAWVRIQ